MLPTKYASFIKRLVAHVIDVIIATSLAALVVIPLVLATVGTGVIQELIDNCWQFNMRAVSHPMLGDMFTPWLGPLAVLPVAAIVFGILFHKILYWLYFAVFESSPRQATPGKMMLGLFVTDEQGCRISFPRALGRTMGKILSGMFCWLGYLLALFTNRKQALHDLMANTLVLEPAYPAPYADMAPPQVTPPAGSVSPDLSGVAVPAYPTPTDPQSGPASGVNQDIIKPEEPASGENKPEQENK